MFGVRSRSRFVTGVGCIEPGWAVPAEEWLACFFPHPRHRSMGESGSDSDRKAEGRRRDVAEKAPETKMVENETLAPKKEGTCPVLPGIGGPGLGAQ